MLSGVRDEVVPREHMRELWEIISRRQGSGVQTDREPKTNVSEVGGGKSKFREFEHGSHSMFQFDNPNILQLSLFLDDTCVQHGYWIEIGEFVASLSRL